jgi:hypothetical protein
MRANFCASNWKFGHKKKVYEKRQYLERQNGARKTQESTQRHTNARTNAMTEKEDEDFYVRYYVVRAFRVSFFLSLVLSSFFFFAFCARCAISIFPIARLYIPFYAFVSPSLSLSLSLRF